MATNKEIQAFAIKYYNLYMNPQATFGEATETFADECLTLGFKVMKYGEGLEREYPDENVWDAEGFDEISDDITDVHLLGSAIFSKWTAMEQDDFSELSFRTWFIIAFARLATITDEQQTNPFVLTGKLKRFKLVSGDLNKESGQTDDQDAMQVLTVSSDGGIWLKRYKSIGNAEIPWAVEKIATNKETLESIMQAFSSSFKDYDASLAFHVRVWQLELVDTEDRIVKISGLMFGKSTFRSLSEFMREKLGRNDLLLFDGNYDPIDRIEAKYDRNTKIMMKDREDDYVIWDYHEKLVVDRESETIEYFRQIAEGCDVCHKYHVSGGVSQLLDNLNADVFSKKEGNPTDVYVDPLESRDYQIDIRTRRGKCRKITGTFDKKDLPINWSEFIESLLEFVSFYGMGEMLDERKYGKIRHRRNELIFCSVTFGEYGNQYWYLADEDIFEPGDFVIVPVGEDRYEEIARIESIEYHVKEEAPYPLDKIKHILRKFDRKTDEGLLR